MSLGLSTGKLKSPARMSLLGVAIASSRNFKKSENNCGVDSLLLLLFFFLLLLVDKLSEEEIVYFRV